MTFLPLDRYRGQVGTFVGFSPWRRVTQEAVNLFAEATCDRRPLHVGPIDQLPEGFSLPIAHGLFTLSLIVSMRDDSDVPDLADVKYALNYGFDKVRLIEPVVVGSEVRAGFRLLDFKDEGAGKFKEAMEVTVHLAGSDRPALVAEWLVMYFLS